MNMYTGISYVYTYMYIIQQKQQPKATMLDIYSKMISFELG